MRCVRRVVLHLGGVIAHLLGSGTIDKLDRAFNGVADVVVVHSLRGALAFCLGRKVGAGMVAFAVADEERFVVGTDGDSGRIPTARDEAVDDGSGGIMDVDDRDVVVIGVGDEERFAVGRESERVGRAAFGRIRVQ